MNKRDLIGKIFRRRVELFDLINNSSNFYVDQKAFFGDAPCVGGRAELQSFVIDGIGGEAVTYLEFGVWKGESFRRWVEGNSNPASRFVGFDTFTGLPEDWTPDAPAGTFSTDAQPPRIEDARAHFEIGLFQDTLYRFLEAYRPTGRLVVHVDCDLYSSTLFTLATIDRILVPGTVVIFDDFHSLNHEYQAWRDYRRGFPHEWRAVATTDGCTQVAVELLSR
jgi:O-methyltransferase